MRTSVQGHQDLRTTDYKQHKDRNPVRVDRTCEWFLKHPTFVAWRETTQSSLLWVSANPGCGKSVLAKSLVDNELKSTDSRKTCYFFFKDDNISQRSATNALCALLHQLFSQKPELLKKALPHFKKNGSKLPQLFTALWDTLVDVSTDPKAGEIICVLDALDECEKSDQVHLINAFDRFYRNYPGGGKKPILKVLVTSRPYFDIERQFRGLTTLMPSIRLVGEEETESISREIDIFIKARVQEIGSRLNLEDSVCSYLEQRLLNIEHRTYLWLKLILELIYSRLDVTTERRLRAIIDTLPDTVEKTYEAILERSTDVDQAKKLLHIIVSAVRPMTLREINVALAVEEGSKSYEDLDLEPDSSFPTTVRNLCGLFVSVVDSKLYLIHQTAKEFLVSDKHAKQHAKHGICSNGAWKCSLEPAESNLVLAKICISYLLFAEFESDPLVIDDRDSDRVIEGKVAQYTAKHDFLDYAAKHWATHLLRVGTDEQVAVFVSNIGFWDSRSKRFLTWFPIYWTTLATFRFPQNFTHLMTASYFGHAGIVAYLLQKGASIDVNCKDSTYGWTPLWWAAWHGQEVIAILLLKETSRVDVNARASNSWTLLLWAAETGSGEIVKLLLERGTGVDVNAKDSHFGRTPLWWAAQSRHEAIVTLLLEKADGIEVNSKDCNDQTLLSWAAQIGDERTVALLLETGTGIDVDSKDHNGLTPLLLAVQNGHEEVVSILLKKGIGINVNAKDRNGRTPLWWAAWSGNKAITALLLELETIVDVNCEDCRGRTPLSMAARKGSYAVVEMLLERGIDINVNSKDHRDWTPMLWGASNGHERVVDALLEKGVGIEIDSRDSDNRTPLWWAANNGYSEVVAVLLEKGIGIDVNSKDSKYGGTPLWWAARNGYSQVVTVLLEKGVGVDVNAKDSKYGGTPLWWAARNGYLQVVAVLLEKGNGVDANAKDSESGGTPLWWAARNGYSQVVALLLEKGIGVDVNSKESESGGTPLFWAIRNRHMAVIKLLSPPTSK
jgi:ankyrin repeat protein